MNIDGSFLSSTVGLSPDARQTDTVQQAPGNAAANAFSGGQQEPLERRPMRQASGPMFEAALREREALSYDEPGDSQRRALGQYQQVAQFEQRDQIQQMVGVDLYV